MGGFQLRREDVRFCLRLDHCDFGLQAAHQGQGIAPGAPEIHDGRDENILVHTRRENRTEVEAGGENANYGYCLTIHRDRLPDNRRVRAKLPSPKALAQQRGRPTAFLALFRQVKPAEGRLHSQHGKEIAGHFNADELLGVAGPVNLYWMEL